MDADALRHHLKIDIDNVHDTQCWHEALTGDVDVNLNNVLAIHGLSLNVHRDKGRQHKTE
jgi:hypothetical protein